MKTRALTFLLCLLLVSGSLLSQVVRYNYQYAKAFPNDNFKGTFGAQGISVDPAGKVWIQLYSPSDSILNSQGLYTPIRVIYCFNPDGSQAPFSPIKMVTVGGKTDTLFNSNRGMRVDPNGNVIFAAFDSYYRLNYKTGTGMNKVVPLAGQTVTAPGFDTLNEMFTGFVIPGIGPIKIYDPNFYYLGNVTDTTVGFSRTLDVSKNGNDVLFAGFTEYFVSKFHSENGSLGPYSKRDSVMKGLVVEAIARHPKTGYWWVGAGDPTSGTNLPPYNNYTYYAFAPPNYMTPVDSLTWNNITPDEPRPRGIAFSPTGDTVYVCAFNVSTLPCVQMFIKGGPLPTITVAPNSFALALQQGDSTTRTLTIGNTGAGTLNWSINNLLLSGAAGSNQQSSAKSFFNEAWSKGTRPAAGDRTFTNRPVASPRADAKEMSSIGGGKILLLAAEGSGSNFTEAKSALISTGLFAFSDIDSLQSPLTISLTDLLPYSAVLLWTNSTFSNPQAIGDALRQYVDAGGGVVIATYALSTSWAIQGGILAANYSPFMPASQQTVSGVLNMASITVPGHPIFQGIVNAPQYWSNENYSNPTLNTGGKLLAKDTQGNNLVGENPNGKVVGIAIFPSYLDQGNAEARILVANALRYVGGGGSRWLTVAPNTGSVAPGSSQDVTVKFNTKTLSTGTYSNAISITSNDLANNPSKVPVTLAVTAGPSPAMTVTPGAISLSLQQGDSTTRTLTIGNVGVAGLTWSIAGGAAIAPQQYSLSSRADVLSLNPDAIKSQSISTARTSRTLPLLEATLAGLAGKTIGITDTLLYSITVADLRARGAVVVPIVFPITSGQLSTIDVLGIDDDIYNASSSDISAIQNWLQAGKGLLVQGDNQTSMTNINSLLAGSGIQETSYGTFLTAILTKIFPHPTTVGVDTIYGSGYGSYATVSSPAEVVVLDSSSYPHACASQLNGGRVFVVCNEVIDYGIGKNRLFANQIYDWLAGSTGFWSVSPKSGSVAVGSSQNVTVNISAKKLGNGTVNDNIAIASNDPLNNPKNVPLNLNVIGPVITSVVPNTAVRGQVLNVTITGQNTDFRVVQGSSTVDANHVWFSQGSSTISANSVSVSSATSLTASFAIPGDAATGGWNVNIEEPAAKGVVTSYSAFTITAPSSLTLLSPNGGENWVSGLMYYIQWSSTNVAYVTLEYSTNGGSTWSTIVSSYPGGAQPVAPGSPVDKESMKARFMALGPASSPQSTMFLWTVPNTPSTTCLVRVTDASNSATRDVSDNVFTILSSTPTGYGWSTQLTDVSKSFIGVKAVDALTAWAYGGNTVMKTTNGGATWLDAKGNLSASGFYALEATSAAVAWGGTSAGTIYYTSDGGATWTQQTSLGVYIDAIKLIAPNVLLATSDPAAISSPYGILRSTNNGGTWSKLSSGVPNCDSTMDWPWYNLDQVGTTLWFGTSSGRVIQSNDNGITWSAVARPLSSVNGLSFSNASVGVVVGYNGAFARTTNGGLNWSSYSTGMSTTLRACQLPKGNVNGWIAGYNGTVLKSTNTGVTWTQESPGTSSNLEGLAFVSDTVGWVVGGGVILKYSSSLSAPVIVSVSPNTAAPGQTLPVTITGQNTSFRVVQGSSTIDASSVWFSQGSSTISAYSVNVSSATNLTAYFSIPSSAPLGMWNVNVQQPAGKGLAYLANGFTINGSGTFMSLSDIDVDFVGVRVGQISDYVFTIRDSSASSGNLTGSVGVTGTGFTIVSGGGSFTLSPGQQWNVTIRFSASSAGFARGTLTINSNSSNYSNPLAIAVRGYGVQLSSNPMQIMFDTTHGFKYSLGVGYFSDLIKLLSAAGHTVQIGRPFDLSGINALITAVQTRAFTSGEITQVQSFVNSGGKLLILADGGGYYGYKEQNQLLSATGWSTGITVDSSAVMDPLQSLYGTATFVKIFTFPNPSDQLLRDVDTLGTFYGPSLTVHAPGQAVATTTSGGSTAIAPLSAEALRGDQLWGTGSFSSMAASHGPSKSAFAAPSGVDPESAPSSLASLLPVIAQASVGSGQVVVIGDGNMWTNPFPSSTYPGPVCIRYGANRVFALNAFQKGNSIIPVPRILSIRDVPNDNGKQVFVRWKVDQPAVSSGIARFGVWRKDSVWTFLKDSVLAVNDTVFQFVAPTVFDSTKVSGMRYTTFRVSAHNVNPQIYTVSSADSGYSVDNLAPSVPKGVKGSVQSLQGMIVALLQWNGVPEKDLRYYAVYRSETQGFALFDSSTFVGASADTTYRDSTVTNGKKYYYRIVAIDWSGNRSGASDEFALTITSVGRVGLEIPKEFSLMQNYPNPFNPATIIRFGIPARSRVTIEVFNTIGQRVASLLDGEKEAGYFEVEWRASAASGIYLYRIEATALDNPKNVFIQVKKMMLLR